MTKRDGKFVGRILIVTMLALVMSLGVRIALESGEIEKLLPRSSLRDTMLFLAPMVSLLLFHYMMAVKSFGFRSLGTEVLAYLTAVCLFLSITSSYYFGGTVVVPAPCPAWKLWGCHPEEARSVNFVVGAAFALASMLCLVLLIRKEWFPNKFPGAERA